MLATSYQRQREYRRQRGSSIVELVIVVAIVVILSGMAIINTMGSSNTTRANNATDAVVDALRQARQLAVTKRRNVLVSFNGTNQVQLTMEPQPGEAAPTPFPVVQLNDGTKNALQFYLFSSLPNTPMGPLGFGNNSAIDLEPVNGGGTATVVLFSSSGSLVGPGGVATANYYAVGNNDPINATIYIGNPGNTATARAITVVGATGRVRSYAWNGLAWQE